MRFFTGANIAIWGGMEMKKKEKAMMKVCRFNRKLHCGHSSLEYCKICPIRPHTGQALITSDFTKIDELKKQVEKGKLTPKEAVTIAKGEIKAEAEQVYDPEQIVTCTYCLFDDFLKNFGYDGKHKMVQCPDCGQRQRISTLMMDITVYEYARWIITTEAWGRISRDKFKQRLKEKGIAKEFWTAYYKAKDDLGYQIIKDEMTEEEKKAEKERVERRIKEAIDLHDY